MLDKLLLKAEKKFDRETMSFKNRKYSLVKTLGVALGLLLIGGIIGHVL